MGGVAGVVVAADGDHRHAVAIAAQQLVDRRVVQLADGVPERVVDGGNRLHQDAPVAQVEDMEGAVAQIDIAEEHLLPEPLDIMDIFADQQRDQMVAHESDNPLLRLVFITAKTFTHHTVFQVNTRDNRVAVGNLVGAAQELGVEFAHQGDDFDCTDFYNTSLLCSGVLQEFDDYGVPPLPGMDQGGDALTVGQVDISAGVDQQADHFDMARAAVAEDNRFQ